MAPLMGTYLASVWHNDEVCVFDCLLSVLKPRVFRDCHGNGGHSVLDVSTVLVS